MLRLGFVVPAVVIRALVLVPCLSLAMPWLWLADCSAGIHRWSGKGCRPQLPQLHVVRAMAVQRVYGYRWEERGRCIVTLASEACGCSAWPATPRRRFPSVRSCRYWVAVLGKTSNQYQLRQRRTQGHSLDVPGWRALEGARPCTRSAGVLMKFGGTIRSHSGPVAGRARSAERACSGDGQCDRGRSIRVRRRLTGPMIIMDAVARNPSTFIY